MDPREGSRENLIFPPSFFMDEVREGFYVSTMMKRYFAAQLKVLYVCAQICEKHGIRYFADYGTLLGAVRHGGYVPWDDDLDICMLRSDWNRFFAAADKELPKSYKVLTISRDKEYSQIIGRVVNSGAIDYSPEHMREFFGCPYVVGIDIFPLDGIYDDEDREKDRNRRARKALADLERDGSSQKNLLKVKKIYSECPSDGAKNVGLMPYFIPYGNHKFPRELFEEQVELPFENVMIKASARYNQMLSLEYGDYLKVYKAGGVHDYPVFAELEEMLREKLGHHPYRYTIDNNALLRSVKRYVMRAANMAAGVGGIGTDSTSGDVPGAKKIAAFLPCKAKWWSTMEPVWRRYFEDEEYEVYVIPIFYFDCDFEGNVGEKHDERTLFPDYVKITDCERFDFAGLHPDVIVTQVPYDGFSTVMTVHEYFYSDNLLQFTDELVYVPCFDMDAPVEAGDKASKAIAVFAEQPAVVNADRVVLGSRGLVDFYVSFLTGACGEDTRAYWQQKVVALEDYCGDRCDAAGRGVIHSVSAGCDASDLEWREFLGSHYGKKVILYHFTISFIMEGGQKAVDKIRRAMEVFRDNSDKVVAVVVPQSNLSEELRRMAPELSREYEDVIEAIKADECFIWDEEGKALSHVDKWNGYYGDAAPQVRRCVLAGIPVMIENADC